MCCLGALASRPAGAKDALRAWKTIKPFSTFAPAAAAGCSHRRIMVEVVGRIDGWWNEASST